MLFYLTSGNQPMFLNVAHDFLPKTNSTRASVVMDHFGIDFEQGRHVIAEQLELPVRGGDVVLFTGASGSGKSSLMRALAAKLAESSFSEMAATELSYDGTADQTSRPMETDTVVNLDDLKLPDTLLIDALPLPVEEAMNLLSSCGLGEAHLMLRTPSELSDGQRYRFRLALALSQNPQWIVADEFTATLDRTLAKVIAFNIRRLSLRTGTGFLLATTHEDVTADLSPNLHVQCRLDGFVSLTREGQPVDVSPIIDQSDAEQPDTERVDRHRKKKVRSKRTKSHHDHDTSSPSPSSTTSGFPMRPDVTGRTFLAGITAVTTSDSSSS
ncbi:MAG: ATP-binding cassette domain-containing protein [Planctomycetaceae bacterium]